MIYCKKAVILLCWQEFSTCRSLLVVLGMMSNASAADAGCDVDSVAAILLLGCNDAHLPMQCPASYSFPFCAVRKARNSRLLHFQEGNPAMHAVLLCFCLLQVWLLVMLEFLYLNWRLWRGVRNWDVVIRLHIASASRGPGSASVNNP